MPNSKFVGHSTEIIQQSKIKGPLTSSIGGYSKGIKCKVSPSIEEILN